MAKLCTAKRRMADAKWRLAFARWRLADVFSGLKRFGGLCFSGIMLIGLSLGLGACGASSNLASNFGLKTAEDSTKAQVARPMKTVAFVPLVGVPKDISAKMLTSIKAKARARKIPVTEEIANAGYLVRGYLVASPATTGGKLSYIWDINDSKGTRVHRVLGNEIMKGGKTTNGWSLVNDAVITKVADASSGKLAGYFSSAARVDPPSNSTPALKTTPDGQGPKRISPIAKRQEGTPGDPIVTGAVGKAPKSSLTQVRAVRGAPGDGRISLTNALKGQLKRNGIKLSNTKVAGGYTVLGNVKLNNLPGNKQKVNIVWKVLDANGNRVGTVSQNNVIPKGSLNGAWGPTATAAASAAAKGIVKLLPGKH